MKTNCPNCGAPITGSKCEYCGTVFEMAERIYQDVPDDFLTLNEKRKICGLEEVKTAPPLTQKR